MEPIKEVDDSVLAAMRNTTKINVKSLFSFPAHQKFYYPPDTQRTTTKRNKITNSHTNQEIQNHGGMITRRVISLPL